MTPEKNERLIKQWETTESLLRSATREVRSETHLKEFEKYIGHNELELALDVLENAGDRVPMTREFWWHLKKAAEVMGLDERRKSFQRKMQSVAKTT